jgi:hypothetical protein
MEQDHEALAAKLESIDTNVDWQSAAREMREAIVQVLRSLNELQTRIAEIEDAIGPPSN